MRESNPHNSACKTDAIPLSQSPYIYMYNFKNRWPTPKFDSLLILELAESTGFPEDMDKAL